MVFDIAQVHQCNKCITYNETDYNFIQMAFDITQVHQCNKCILMQILWKWRKYTKCFEAHKEVTSRRSSPRGGE